MIKYYCDKCGNEVIGEGKEYVLFAKDGCGVKLVRLPQNCQLCYECAKEFEESSLDIEDFLELQDGKFEYAKKYNFKVGDIVITSSGKVGVITDLDHYGERKDFSILVATSIGVGRIYITDNDLRCGFASFYQIGNYLFGFIDEDTVDYDIKQTEESIYKLQKEKIDYEAQKDVIQYIKRSKGIKFWEK